MTYQRRRGETVTIHLASDIEDSRGNVQHVADATTEGVSRSASVTKPDSARVTNVAGQVAGESYLITIDPVEGLDLHALVTMRGQVWRITKIEDRSHASRHVRHQALTVVLDH